MTPQDLFTKAYIGVVAQGALSRNDNGSCFYDHATLGLRCAVGHLIDDPKLRRQMDQQGGSVNAMLGGPLVPALPNWFFKNIHLLDQMQKAHDGWGATTPTVDKFKTHMAKIAKEHGFNVPA